MFAASVEYLSPWRKLRACWRRERCRESVRCAKREGGRSRWQFRVKRVTSIMCFLLLCVSLITSSLWEETQRGKDSNTSGSGRFILLFWISSTKIWIILLHFDQCLYQTEWWVNDHILFSFSLLKPLNDQSLCHELRYSKRWFIPFIDRFHYRLSTKTMWFNHHIA